LQILARQAMGALDARRHGHELEANQAGNTASLRTALRAREEKLRAIFDAEPECVKLVSADGILHEMNAAGLRLIEASSLDDIKGKSILPIVVPEDRAACAQLLQAVARGEKRCIEFRIEGFKGVRRCMEMTAVPLRDEATGANLVLAVSHDITEHRRLEEQFRHSQKMEAIGQLAGGVAHDFNNLLTVIQGNASLLQETVGEVAQEHVQDILQAAERAAGLTRQLLLFSRKQVMQPVELDLNEAVEKTIRMLRRVLGENIALHTEFSPDLPLVLADAGMIEQALLNLAINSRDAMPGGGRLSVSTSAEFVDDGQALENPEMPAGLCACLAVSDTGSGIPPEIMPHIFEPFFTSKEVGKGTGLGLATVYGIVKQHRGAIKVESEPGKGSLFRLYLPAVEGSPVRREAAAVATNLPTGNETILLVEDEPSLRALASQLLQRCGYNLLVAPSGIAALAVWGDHKDRIQLLLTDMVLPGSITGRQLAEILHRERAELPVVFTSGYSTDVTGGKSLVEGVNFLQKPYQAQKLAEIVREALDRS
jgi:two-component system, cell cycle sensor histidine kinase and response regulator CckA